MGYVLAPHESADVFAELLSGVKSRGAEQVLFFVSDGLKGISDVIYKCYPRADIQKCLVHVFRNIASKVRKKD